jgi:hypothetical protein
MTLLRTWLADDDRAGVVLAGDAGVGKTRLGTEYLAVGADAGYVTLRAIGTRAGQSLPFGAFATLLPGGEPNEPGSADNRVERAAVDAAGR